GGVAPVNGDTVTIASGHTVDVDADITLGSSTSNVGHAFTLNGASSSSYGTLRVLDGVSLTIAGRDTTTNSLGLINQYGTFAPQPGSTGIGKVPSDFASVILNKGIVSAVGTGAKPITFTSPSASYSWANSSGSETVSSGTNFPYAPSDNVACI